MMMDTSIKHAINWSLSANKRASKYIEVKKSGIHNYGVFARTRIKKGTKVIEYTGQYCTKEESDKRQDRDANNGTVYVFTLNKKYDIDGAVGGSHARLINHSCDPNCETLTDDDHIWIIAIRDIEPGEELSYDYNYDTDAYEEHPCRCGAKNCRGYIIGEEHHEKLVKEGKWNHINSDD